MKLAIHSKIRAQSALLNPSSYIWMSDLGSVKTVIKESECNKNVAHTENAKNLMDCKKESNKALL